MRWFKRATYAFLPLMLAMALASASRAHEGAHGPDMVADVISAQILGSSVSIELNVINLGGPLVLTGLSAVGARQVAFPPVYLNFAEDVVVAATLEFGAPPPTSFVLQLDFGVVGQGSVVIFPDTRSPGSKR